MLHNIRQQITWKWNTYIDILAHILCSIYTVGGYYINEYASLPKFVIKDLLETIRI